MSGSISYCLMFLGVIGTHSGTKRIATTPKSDEKNATTLEKRNVGSQGQTNLKKQVLGN